MEWDAHPDSIAGMAVQDFLYHIGNVVRVYPSEDGPAFLKMVVVAIDGNRLALRPFGQRERTAPTYADWMAN